MYLLTEEERLRFKQALLAAIAVPFIDDIEDFIVEAIWEYTKWVDGPDPFFHTRSKNLYDVVDPANHIGWSVKSIQWKLKNECEFELIIQRADVYKKAKALGFDYLDQNSDPNLIGMALLRHWHNKMEEDARQLHVESRRVMILLKSRNKKNFIIYEDDIHRYEPSEIHWEWTNDKKNGLKGIHRPTNFCVYRWYSSQKQLFERFRLPPNVQKFEIAPYRLTKESIVEILLPFLPKQP